MLKIQLIGQVALTIDGAAAELPSSRKTRALLAYLVLSPGKHSRQALCDLLWDQTDDPRAALRWSLSKLRPLIGAGLQARLESDRQYVWLELDESAGNAGEIALDWQQLTGAAADKHLTAKTAETIWQSAQQALLDDCELPNNSDYTAWLNAMRTEMTRAKIGLAKRFALDPAQNLSTRDRWAERWLAQAPFDGEAARCAVQARHAVGRREDAEALAERIALDFGEAGIAVPPLVAEKSARSAPARDKAVAQKIQFVETDDDVCIAWASLGEEAAPPLVKAANWLSHLELDWEAPIWSPLFRELAASHRLIRYDERGCGLSDWDVGEIGFESFVTDLERVVDAAGLDRFPLLGISQGASVSIEYAARHPERVSHLILFGGYDCGWRHTATPDEVREREAVMVLTETGWGRENPAYRHLFSQTFMPDALPEELDWFDEFQRQTTSPANAVRFLEAFATIDVRERLGQIQCPTLVVHSRGDLRIPFSTGRALASRIPGAQLAGVESNNHLLLGREPASAEFVELVQKFVS